MIFAVTRGYNYFLSLGENNIKTMNNLQSIIKGVAGLSLTTA